MPLHCLSADWKMNFAHEMCPCNHVVMTLMMLATSSCPLSFVPMLYHRGMYQPLPLSSCVVRFYHSCIYTATDGPTKCPADKDKHGNALTRITPFNNIKANSCGQIR